MITVLTLRRSLAIPLYVTSCVASNKGPFGLGGNCDIDDPLTEILQDDPALPATDWWNTGKEAWVDVDDYVKAWRAYEARKKVSPCPILGFPKSHENVLCKHRNSPVDLMSLTSEEIDRRLQHLRTTRQLFVETFERLLLEQQLVLQDEAKVSAALEEADSLEVDEFRRKIPTPR